MMSLMGACASLGACASVSFGASAAAAARRIGLFIACLMGDLEYATDGNIKSGCATSRSLNHALAIRHPEARGMRCECSAGQASKDERPRCSRAVALRGSPTRAFAPLSSRLWVTGGSQAPGYDLDRPHQIDHHRATYRSHQEWARKR